MNKIKCKVRLRRRRKVVQASCTACARGSAVVERGTWRLLLIERHPPHQTSTTLDIHHTRNPPQKRTSSSGPVCGCLVWWMSDFTHGVVNVQSGQCLVWWISFFAHSVADIWFGLVDVCVWDVIKSILMQLKCSLNLSPTLALRILGYYLHHTCKNALMAIFDLGWL